MRMLIKGGRVVDPAGPSGKIDGIMDVLVEAGKIARIVPAGAKTDFGTGSAVAGRVIDAAGLIVTPGLIDMHVHLREPGHEYKETIQSGCLAAVHGGFTAVCAMANTRPVNDSAQVTEYILNRARKAATARVYPVAAVSKGTLGTELCEYGELKAAGAVALSDDGVPIVNNQLMRKALEYAKGFGLTIVTHCEYPDLIANGVMNEGPFATRLGLAGSPNAVESMMVMRDIALCELTGSPVHIAHISTREAVRAVREAKARGAKVTAETAPHYFTLTDEAVGNYNTHAKMSPPLRAPLDREAIREGLADGTIDAIASDHAPHSSIEKDVEFDYGAAGIIGLETSLGLSWQLVTDGLISVSGLVEKMSTNPARIFGLKSGLAEGNPADITLIDPAKTYTVDASLFKSLSRNTPFNGRQLKGGAVLTMVAGKVVFDALS